MKQRELPVLGNIKQTVKEVPWHLIEACKNKKQAIALCIKWSDMQHYVIAELIGENKGNFSRIASCSGNLNHNKENLLQDVCGNEAIINWVNWSRNYKAIPIDNSEKIAELQAQIKLMQGVA